MPASARNGREAIYRPEVSVTDRSIDAVKHWRMLSVLLDITSAGACHNSSQLDRDAITSSSSSSPASAASVSCWSAQLYTLTKPHCQGYRSHSYVYIICPHSLLLCARPNRPHYRSYLSVGAMSVRLLICLSLSRSGF